MVRVTVNNVIVNPNPEKESSAMSTISYSNTEYTKKSLFNLKGPELVALHNKLATKLGNPTTKRFSSIGAGVDRTWKLLEEVGTAAKPAAPKAAPKQDLTASMGTPVAKAKRKRAEPKEGAARRGTNLAAPGHAPLPCREGSKQAYLLDKLSSSKGATMDELIEALSGGNKPWTEATVRAGFGWDMKQKGYGVRSEFDDKGVERFFIVLPAGHTRPAHTPLKTATPKSHAGQGRLKA